MNHEAWEQSACVEWVEKLIVSVGDGEFVEHATLVEQLLEIEESSRFIAETSAAMNKPLRWVAANLVFWFSRELAGNEALSRRIERKRLATGWAYRARRGYTD